MLLHRGSQAKALLAHRMGPAAMSDPSLLKAFSKPRPKQLKAKAEPPPKKRKKWKEAFTTSPSASSPEAVSEDDGEDLLGRLNRTQQVGGCKRLC